MKHRIPLALAGIFSVLGLTMASTTPASAATYSGYRYCGWLDQAVIKVSPSNSTSLVVVKVYSPSGYFLGSNGWRGTYTWWTKWEDIRYTVSINGATATVSSSCF